jgi:hypothetical protein
MSRRGSVCLFVFTALQIFATTAGALTLRVEKDAVVATEVTRGGSAVFFAVTFQAGPVPERARKAAVLRDEDGDGTVTLEMPDGVPFIGIWSVVDLATGAVKLGAKEGYRVIELEDLLAASFRRDREGRFETFEYRADDVEMLVVRPGEGAWTMQGTNGAAEDQDYAVDGKLVLGLERLVPVAEHGKAADGVRAGDVVVMIDVASMRASAATLGVAK